MAVEVETRWQRIRTKIEAVGHMLEQQGSLASRQAGGRRVWSVRYVAGSADGPRRQRAIYIGHHPLLVDRARGLVEFYRALGRWDQEAEAAAKLGAAIVAAARAG